MLPMFKESGDYQNKTYLYHSLVKYKLALAKIDADDWTTRAFTICLCRNWTWQCYSCWPSTPPEGVQGGVRHSVLQAIWWVRSSDRCFRNRFYNLNLCISSYLSEVAQSYVTLWDPIHCSLPGSSVLGIFQARVLEWVAISFFRGSPQPRDQTQVSRIAGRCFTLWATSTLKLIGRRLQIFLSIFIDCSHTSCLSLVSEIQVLKCY